MSEDGTERAGDADVAADLFEQIQTEGQAIAELGAVAEKLLAIQTAKVRLAALPADVIREAMLRRHLALGERA